LEPKLRISALGTLSHLTDHLIGEDGMLDLFMESIGVNPYDFHPGKSFFFKKIYFLTICLLRFKSCGIEP
jgi:hypothetical protein